ncbi:MAG TPA: MTH1187 family thiamine-binding protein [Dehalococcoidia bacterium]|nr:MTH1187 family thiamine-binding protein [Dehalococcoidia bacterium]
MVIAEVSLVPMGTKTPSASKYVAKALKVLRKEKGLKYQLTAMGTLLEGDLNEVLEVAKKMHQCLFDEDVKRVVSTIRIDDRRDKMLTIDYKVESVMKKLK